MMTRARTGRYTVATGFRDPQEVCRLRGILLLQQPATPPVEAEAWVRRALDVARRQEAKSLELRAAMSLARLWQQQGKCMEARELLSQHAVAQPGEAETWLQQALAMARRQQARSLELRAAMSLARLWLHQGKRTEARELLAEVYGWFTEGFDTADLQEAQVLLAELA